MARKNKNEEFMTGYEVRVFDGWKKTAADMLKDKKMLETTLKRALGHEVDMTLETGETVNVPVIDALVLTKIAFDLKHPANIDLKVYSAVLGETKQVLEVESTPASEMFKGITANGSDSGQKQ